MTDVRIAFVGCGRIAWAHAYGWSQVPGAQIVGMADLHRPGLDVLADAFEVPTGARHGDFRTMLDAQHPDVVVITTWHAHHVEAVLAAASRGARLILCEKPMATSLGEAEQMVVACERASVLFAVGHQRRFYPGWEAARKLLAEGALGRLSHAWTTVRDGLLNNGSHNIDLVRYVTGDPCVKAVTGAVQRDTDRYERGCRAEDSSLAMVELDGGVRLFLESDIDPAGTISANVILSGSDGMLRIKENHVELLNGSSEGWRTVAGVPLGSDSDPGAKRDDRLQAVHELVSFFGPDNADAFAQTFVAQAIALKGWLVGDEDVYRGEARQGMAAIEVVMAIYESARRREVVRLPLRTRVNPLDLMVESGDLAVDRPGRYDIRSMLVRGESMSW